jgi:hypothetical protein
VGTITVPDERLNKLADLVHPQNILPTTVEIVDIAGLVKGASKGEGLGNKFLGNIRECNAILHVLRCFDNDNVIHVDGKVNPVHDKEIIDTELQLKDLESVDAKIRKFDKLAKTGQDKEAVKTYDTLMKFKQHLESGQSARSCDVGEENMKYVEDLHLLTIKPVMYVCNVDEASAKGGNKYVDAVREATKGENAEILVITAQMESEIAALETYEEKQMFLAEMGLDEPGVNKLIKSAYKLLNLQTYFTAGEKEVRAWTITKGMKAPQAAGVIHSDFERGFIKAEVIAYNDYVALGSEAACREVGKLRQEGKEYTVADGDVMHFKFNV